MESRMYERIHEGMDVCDRDGDKIGKACEAIGQFFKVDGGFLGRKEYYVPFDAITEFVDNAVYLNVDKDELANMGWDQRPDETTEGETLRLREEELRARKSSVEKSASCGSS